MAKLCPRGISIIRVCLFVCEQLPDHNSTPNFTTMFVYLSNRNYYYIFGYHKSKVTWDISQCSESELFSAQATDHTVSLFWPKLLYLHAKHRLWTFSDTSARVCYSYIYIYIYVSHLLQIKIHINSCGEGLRSLNVVLFFVIRTKITKTLQLTN